MVVEMLRAAGPGVAVDAPVFRVLGPIQVGTGRVEREVTAAKPRAVLVMLLVHPNEWVSVGRLVDVVWGERPPRSAVGNLKTYVWQLRALLTAATGSDRVDSRRGGYRLVVNPAELDLYEFERLADRGGQALIAGEPSVAAGLLRGALALWRGDPYEDAPHPLVEVEVAYLRERRWTVREQLLAAELACGRAAEAVAMARSLLVEQPLRERLWATLIAGLGQLDRRAEALAAYRELYQLLRRELGLTPGPRVRAAHQAILGG
jgi:DNA-binding SARP family transcriptional activator